MPKRFISYFAAELNSDTLENRGMSSLSESSFSIKLLDLSFVEGRALDAFGPPKQISIHSYNFTRSNIREVTANLNAISLALVLPAKKPRKPNRHAKFRFGSIATFTRCGFCRVLRAELMLTCWLSTNQDENKMRSVS